MVEVLALKRFGAKLSTRTWSIVSTFWEIWVGISRPDMTAVRCAFLLVTTRIADRIFSALDCGSPGTLEMFTRSSLHRGVH